MSERGKMTEEYIKGSGTGRGGWRGGVKPTLPQELRTKKRTISLTDAEWEKFRQKGGAKWLRTLLND